MKKLAAVLLTFAALAASASAFSKSVSVQIIQNNPGQEKVWATSEFFEQSVINYFFESGRIVSNSPIYISQEDAKEDRKALRAALIENSDGGMDYLARIEVFFNASENAAPDVPKLGNIKRVEWKIYRVGTGIDFSSGSKVPQKVTTKNDNESGINEFAASVARTLSESFE